MKKFFVSNIFSSISPLILFPHRQAGWQFFVLWDGGSERVTWNNFQAAVHQGCEEARGRMDTATHTLARKSFAALRLCTRHKKC